VRLTNPSVRASKRFEPLHDLALTPADSEAACFEVHYLPDLADLQVEDGRPLWGRKSRSLREG
jgi:hypothetical protein